MAICRDIEGWKAVSRLRDFDSTPCFEEGIVISSILIVVLLSLVFKSFSLRLHVPLDKTRKSIWFLKAKLVRLVCFCVLFFFAETSSVILGLTCCLVHNESAQYRHRPRSSQIRSCPGIVLPRNHRVCFHSNIHLLQPHPYATLFHRLAFVLAFVHWRDSYLVPHFCRN